MGIGIKELLIILAIALVIFGTKKLANMGGDLGSAIKNFKRAMKDEESGKDGGAAQKIEGSNKVVDGEVVGREKHKA
jgi:sec-independent protein translocase protein TatA